MKKYRVTVTFKLDSQHVVEANDEAEARAVGLKHLTDRYPRKPNANRKVKQRFANVVCNSAIQEVNPEFYSVHFTADVTQFCLINAEDSDSARTIAESQVNSAYRQRAGQVSFATEVAATKAIEITKK